MQNNLQEVTLILIASSVIILMLTIIIIAALFINQKRKFRFRQQMEDQKKLFEQEILRTQLEIQTQTFETISHELHDNVSNTLAAALLNLNMLEKDGEAGALNRMEETKSLILEAKNAVKDFSWFINPENINSAGLTLSFSQLVEKFSRLKLFTIDFVVEGTEFNLESSRQIIIYRIVQEALSNIVKHSNGSTVQFTLRFNHPQLDIDICDEGPGFNTGQVFSTTMETRGAGLKNMMARAKMIDAHLEINSETGKGTKVSLTYTANRQNNLNLQST